MESRWWGPGTGAMGEWGVIADGYGVSIWGDDVIWNSMEVVVAQHCDC